MSKNYDITKLKRGFVYMHLYNDAEDSFYVRLIDNSTCIVKTISAIRILKQKKILACSQDTRDWLSKDIERKILCDQIIATDLTFCGDLIIGLKNGLTIEFLRATTLPQYPLFEIKEGAE